MPEGGLAQQNNHELADRGLAKQGPTLLASIRLAGLLISGFFDAKTLVNIVEKPKAVSGIFYSKKTELDSRV